jgi:hypothetical protein
VRVDFVNHLIVEGALACDSWNEDLTIRAVRMYRAARHGWAPPAPLPPVPALALLLDLRRRPSAGVVISHDARTAAAVGLHEAERRWHDLPVGGVLSRPWSRPSRTPATAAIPPRGRRFRPAPRPQQHRAPRRG